MNATPLTYKDAGVDIDAGNHLVDNIKPLAKTTTRPGVVSGLGGFGALFELDLQKYPNPLLVSGTDGVGTKLRLAIDHQRYDSVGIDLVAMCVNDLIVQGAEPLFFLDYYATGKLDVNVATQVVAGIAQGCIQAGCALNGGETAEMPDMYPNGDFDLAGFCVGVVNKDAVITGDQVKAGDQLLALASSGPHSNGYSLIRRILQRAQQQNPAVLKETTIHGQNIMDALMQPTRIYISALLSLIETVNVHAMAHITGGGLSENLPRVMPANTKAVIDLSRWQLPDVFQWLQQQGSIEQAEMLRTFNCGIGMVVVVPANQVEQARQQLTQAGETVMHIGEIQANPHSEQPSVDYIHTDGWIS